MLKTILIASLLTLPTIPSHAQQASEPLCFLRAADNTIINLESICNTNKRQNRQLVNIRLAQSSGGLQVSNIRLQKTQQNKQNYYWLLGDIINKRNSTATLAAINFSAYKQSGKSVKQILSGRCSADADLLIPQDTSTCRSLLIIKPDILMIESVVESSSLRQDINTCYTDTKKGEQLCKLLSPSLIRRY